MCLSESMPIHFSRFASPERIAVSLSIHRKATFFRPEAAIKSSISFSDSMKRNFTVTGHFGLIQDLPLNFSIRV